MIKLGVVDFDTSHVTEFTKRLNHKGVAEDQWVNGAQVVIGCPGKSEIMPERIPEVTGGGPREVHCANFQRGQRAQF